VALSRHGAIHFRDILKRNSLERYPEVEVCPLFENKSCDLRRKRATLSTYLNAPPHSCGRSFNQHIVNISDHHLGHAASHHTTLPRTLPTSQSPNLHLQSELKVTSFCYDTRRGLGFGVHGGQVGPHSPQRHSAAGASVGPVNFPTSSVRFTAKSTIEVKGDEPRARESRNTILGAAGASSRQYGVRLGFMRGMEKFFFRRDSNAGTFGS
jgi:hypothetical protein